MTTYDIYFSDGSSSDNKGFSIKTPEKAIHMAEDMLVKGNSYIEDYAGGVISVVSSGGETVWSSPIPESKRNDTVYILNHKIMFSGIVEEYAEVVKVVKDQENLHLTLKCSFVDELKIDQSVSHNGVCLTVVSIQDGTYTVTAMKETIERSNIGLLAVGDKVNVERSMMMNGRLDGHIVQGHVDQTAVCTAVDDAQGSWYFTFKYNFDKEMAKRGYFTVDKGSVTVNGVSLTVCNPTSDTFQVAIIPYTYEHTNFHTIKVGSVVNIEFDIIGKYLSRMMQLTE